MADPTGSIGRAKGGDPALDDLALAYKGGPALAERLSQLSAERDAYDKAFAQFQLGSDVLAARQAAQAELSRAQQLKADADEVYKGARAAAADLVAKAEVRSADLTKAADKRGADAEAAAARIIADARQQAVDIQFAADAVRKEVEQIKARAEQVSEFAQRQAQDQQQLKASVDNEKAAAQKARTVYESKLAKLDAVVRDLHEG